MVLTVRTVLFLLLAQGATLFSPPWTARAMHRSDNSDYFLYIEPDARKRADTPVDDDLTQSLQLALSEATKGTAKYSDLKSKGDFTPDASWRGMHFAEDGEISDVSDFLLPNGFITNSLCVHYARYFRSEIPKTELKKLEALHEFMSTRNSESPDL
jgi:hypothetical protein